MRSGDILMLQIRYQDPGTFVKVKVGQQFTLVLQPSNWSVTLTTQK